MSDNEPSVDLLNVTMTPEAAERFKDALLHAGARTKDDEQANWLLWGAGRISCAQRGVDDGQN